jgi:hypothetical protein
MKLLRTLPVLVLACLFISGCPCILGIGDCDDGTINVDTIFWTAFRDPESFDAWLAGHPADPGAPSCLRHLASKAFSEEQVQLRQCSQMVSGTPEWNDCHDIADQAHNRGVVLNDLGRTCDGSVRFDATEGGQYLMAAKNLVGQSDWYSFADVLRQNSPRFECSR